MKAIGVQRLTSAVALALLSLLLVTQVGGVGKSLQAQTAQAAAQTVISYQGTLTDLSGNPVNTVVSIAFAIYDAPSGGNLQWGPETQSVLVSNGLFNVLLGSLTAMDPANLSGDLYLEITINGETMAPRELLTGVVFSVNASHSPNDFLVSGRLGVGAATATHPLRVTSHWSVLGLDTWEPNQDAGVQLLEDSVVKWHFFNDSSEGNRFTLASEGQTAITIPQSGDVSLYRNLRLAGSNLFVDQALGIGTTTPQHGQVQIDNPTVPLALKETDQSGAGSLWRMPLDGTLLRFDASQNGTDFATYKTPLTLYPDGSLGCGALTEANLQTPEERTAGRIDRFEEGDVLCWGVDRLEKCAVGNDRLVQAVADKSGRPIVIGAEPVKVVGPVKRGDILVASDVPGYAMVNNDPTSGSVIAQALEDFDGEQGIVKAMIRKW